MNECAANNWDYYAVSLDPVWGVSLVLRGDIRGGIRWMEKTILKREGEGYRLAAELGQVSVAQFSDEFNRNCRVLLQKAFAIPLRSAAKGRFTRSVAVPSQTSQGIEMCKCSKRAQITSRKIEAAHAPPSPD
jgi:hypothetical protein